MEFITTYEVVPEYVKELLGLGKPQKDLVEFYWAIDNQLCYTQNSKNFPPMDIFYKKDKFVEIKMALAGFSKEDIEVESEDEFLLIKGKLPEEKVDEDIVYLKTNLRSHEMSRTFKFPDNYFDFRNPKITMINGLLTIRIEKNPNLVSEKKKITIE